MIDALEHYWLALNIGLTPFVRAMGPVVMALVLLAGVVALFAGRRFAWVFTAIMGYLLGLAIGPQLTAPLPIFGQLLVPALAVIGAFLGLAAHRPGAILIGLFAAAGLAAQVLRHYSVGFWPEWLIIITAALCAALATLWWREWMLILVSVVYGAFFTVLGLRATIYVMPPRTQAVIFAVLLVTGLVVQVADYLRTRHITAHIPASAGGVYPAPRA